MNFNAMKELLELLDFGESITIPQSDIIKLLDYTMSLRDCYTFIYEYPDDKLVRITQIERRVRHVT